MTSFNKLTTELAEMQGIEIGSQEWRKAGIQPFSGQSGGHGAYGWRRPEPMMRLRAQAVISNYAARPCYYDAEVHPLRESGYYNGGRPVDWEPEDSRDLPGGERAYATSAGLVAVSGPDIQHCWLDPIYDVIDRLDPTVYVPTPFGRMSAVEVCRILGKSLLQTVTGMVRHDGQWWGGGRTFARVVDTFIQGGKRGLVDVEDAKVFWSWVLEHGLPALEQAPGVVNAKGVGRFNLYQDLSWVGPALWDAWNVVGDYGSDQGLKTRLWAALETRCRWTLDIHAIKGGRGAWNDCAITPAMWTGVAGKTLMGLEGAITADDVEGPEWYGDWAVRMADVCRRVFPGEESEAYFQAVWGPLDKALDREWLVGADRGWLDPTMTTP